MSFFRWTVEIPILCRSHHFLRTPIVACIVCNSYLVTCLTSIILWHSSCFAGFSTVFCSSSRRVNTCVDSVLVTYIFLLKGFLFYENYINNHEIKIFDGWSYKALLAMTQFSQHIIVLGEQICLLTEVKHLLKCTTTLECIISLSYFSLGCSIRKRYRKHLAWADFA